MTTSPHSPEHLHLIMEKAAKSLLGAANLAEDGLYEFAVSRAYYATFYAIEAALTTKGLMAASHKSIITLFNREFVHAGLVPSSLNKSLNLLFKERQNADYSYLASYSFEECQNHIQEATQIVDAMKHYLQSSGFLPPAP
jgi:uncharacterized protein (UPF0332 family)